MTTLEEIKNIVRSYPFHKQAGLYLRLIRRNRRHTQKHIGELLNISNVTICRYECGHIPFTKEHAKSIAKFYKISYKLLYRN